MKLGNILIFFYGKHLGETIKHTPLVVETKHYTTKNACTVILIKGSNIFCVLKQQIGYTLNKNTQEMVEANIHYHSSDNYNNKSKQKRKLHVSIAANFIG
jgi:hypothetical protein